MATMKKLSTGHYIETAHLAAMFIKPWEKLDGVTLNHRVVLLFVGTDTVEIETNSEAEAIALADKLALEIAAP